MASIRLAEMAHPKVSGLLNADPSLSKDAVNPCAAFCILW